MTSKRTKDALKAAKERGTKLGNPNNLSVNVAVKGRELGMEARVKKADAFATKLYGVVKEYQKQGMSLNNIAKKLNEMVF